MFEIFLIAQSLKIIDQYFFEEASEEDFWEVPVDIYSSLKEEEKKQICFMINPKKLNKEYREKEDILILTEGEKENLLKAFKVVYKYTEEFPEGTHFKQRLLIAKNRLPPFFSDSKSISEECKVISFPKNKR